MKDPIQKIVNDIMEKVPSMEPWVAAQVRDAVVDGLKANILAASSQMTISPEIRVKVSQETFLKYVKRSMWFKLVEHVKDHIHEKEELSDLFPAHTSTLYIVRKL